jgi:hypothetical protein
MRGICDTCDQVSELFQLAGRADANCRDCHTQIGTVIELYRTLDEVKQSGHDGSALEAQLKITLEKLAIRVRLNSAEPTAQSLLN